MKKHRTWTEELVQTLYQLHEQKLSIPQIAAKMGLSYDTIRGKLFREGMIAPELPKKPWTAEEEELLRDLVGQGFYLEDVNSYFPGRTKKALRIRAVSLGCPFPKPKSWSDKELFLIESLAGERPLSYIQKQLPHRTKEAIAIRLKKIGISTITDTDYWIPVDFARLIGKSKSTIHDWIYKRGLKAVSFEPRRANANPNKRRLYITRNNFKLFYRGAKGTSLRKSLARIDPEIIDWIFDGKKIH